MVVEWANEGSLDYTELSKWRSIIAAIFIGEISVDFWWGLKNEFIHEISEYVESQEDSSYILNHGEGTRTLQSKMPCGGSSDLGFDTVGNWSNEFLSIEHFGVFRVDEWYNSQFDNTDEYNNNILLLKVPINTDIDYEPDNLRNHQNKPNNK